MDNNATTTLRDEVKKAMYELPKLPYNPSSIHSYGREARKIIEEARVSILSSLGLEDDIDNYNVIFTSTGTEANNLVISNFIEDNIYISSIEHSSVYEPASLGTNTVQIPVTEEGILKLEYLEDLISKTEGRKLVSVIFANNETGVIQDIRTIAKLVHKYNGFLHIDAVQALGKIKVNLKELDADMVTVSAHKCGGPIGAAALIAKKSVPLTSMMKGGGQEKGFRSGTENVISIYGFGITAIKASQEIEKFEKIEILRNKMEQAIQYFANDAEIISKDVKRLNNTSMIIMPKVNSQMQIMAFDLAGIAVSAGSACSSGKTNTSHVLRSMGIPNEKADCAIRVSLSPDNTTEEIDYFVNEWKNLYQRIYT
ncbi:MAG: cysteine desulfurase family protein [Alphaproteobacteria bacterium]